ncbi:MAG: hypothetical protein RMJ03_04155 [Nitrososphaerota archaeon]|nr:hypothetical protein [Nitrososphaerota archaeon]
MENGEIIGRIKENVLRRVNTDKIMWFSMWFLVSITTFGLALFPMIYQLIERRNRHFHRQKELETFAISVLKRKGINIEVEPEKLRERNSFLWTLSIVLIVPIFAVAFFLSKDLLLHERRQVSLFKKILPDEDVAEQKIDLKFYVAITLATLGVGIIYWLYRVFNDYNNHFKEQWKIEDRMVELLG